MTCLLPAAEAESAAVERAQLRLALASVSYMSGDVARSRTEAEAVLAEPGLPAPLYAAAEQRRLLALLSGGDHRELDSWTRDVQDRDASGGAALMARAALAWRDGRGSDALELLWAATRSGAGADAPGEGGYPALGLAIVFAALGLFDEAQSCVLAATGEIVLGGDPLWAAAPALFSARVDLAAGRLDAARETAQSGLELAAQLGTPILNAIARDVLVTAALRRGEVGEATEQVECWRADPLVGWLPFGIANRDWAALRVRDAQGAPLLGDAATDAAFDLVASNRCLLLEDPSAAGWLVRIAHRHGDERRVRFVVRTAEHLAVINHRYPSVVAAAAHAAGIAHQDVRCLERAATRHQMRWARASAAEDAARLHRQQGDRRTARTWLERAAGEYSACGATRDSARIRSRRRDLGVRSDHWSRKGRPADGWDSLTETEQAVARLVAEGLTNQKVATRMFVSRHTVDFHLRQIFRKLSIDSRVMLTRIALSCDEVAP